MPGRTAVSLREPQGPRQRPRIAESSRETPRIHGHQTSRRQAADPAQPASVGLVRVEMARGEKSGGLIPPPGGASASREWNTSVQASPQKIVAQRRPRRNLAAWIVGYAVTDTLDLPQRELNIGVLRHACTADASPGTGRLQCTDDPAPPGRPLPSYRLPFVAPSAASKYPARTRSYQNAPARTAQSPWHASTSRHADESPTPSTSARGTWKRAATGPP